MTEHFYALGYMEFSSVIIFGRFFFSVSPFTFCYESSLFLLVFFFFHFLLVSAALKSVCLVRAPLVLIVRVFFFSIPFALKYTFGILFLVSIFYIRVRFQCVFPPKRNINITNGKQKQLQHQH